MAPRFGYATLYEYMDGIIRYKKTKTALSGGVLIQIQKLIIHSEVTISRINFW